MSDPKLPLGRETGYPQNYEPDVLFAIARSESRQAFLSGELPFSGTDIWNAWELTWLGPGGLPVVATAEIRVPATSPSLIESKSLKLYLNSFAMSRFDAAGDVGDTIAEDLARCTGADVEVRITLVAESEANTISRLPGRCLDTLPVTCDSFEVDAAVLAIDRNIVVEEDLHTHLLRSLCPVTAQPDMGSLAIHYRGPGIDAASLLKYIVSFREHSGFHEACVERIFVDLLNHCACERLSVLARFQRRGGIDINPFRSNFEEHPQNPRLWRQ